MQVKALACELPATHDQPLSRWSLSELTQHVCQSGLVASLSDSTLWRWLHQDAIRPWQHRCWIFPRDPDFAAKAGRILDLYQRQWQDQAPQEDEFVISADEKTSIQARHRLHPALPPQPGIPMKVEHEYERRGAWAYLAALDVHRAKVFGRCEAQSGINPFDRLVAQCPVTHYFVDAEPIRVRGEFDVICPMSGQKTAFRASYRSLLEGAAERNCAPLHSSLSC